MRNKIASILFLIILFFSLPCQVHAQTYVNGYNDGKSAGYELGKEAGYNKGYDTRSAEAQTEIMMNTIKTASISAAICMLIGFPMVSAITSYFINRKRDRTENELRSQNEKLKFDLIQWQNRVLFGKAFDDNNK